MIRDGVPNPDYKPDAGKPHQDYKHDAGKPRLSLVPPGIMTAIARIREYGCEKYHDPENWKKVECSRYLDAALRHLLAFVGGEIEDEESGLHHLWHCSCNLAFLCELEPTSKSKLK